MYLINVGILTKAWGHNYDGTDTPPWAVIRYFGWSSRRQHHRWQTGTTEGPSHECLNGGVHEGHHQGVVVAGQRLEEVRRLQGLSGPGAGRDVDQATVGSSVS